jgi:negative regulator of flagellin synthesis FlgM
MQINSLQSVNALQSATRAANAKPSGPVAAPVSVQPSLDQLDLSAEAKQLMASQAAMGSADGDIRVDRVAAVRQAIADGTYETPEKMSLALDRLLDTLA